MRLTTPPERKGFTTVFILLIIALFGTIALEYFPGALTMSSAERPLVVLDAGHGGTDPGVFAAGLTEKDITLEVARYLRDYLESSGCRVIMLRNRDANFGEDYYTQPKSLRRDLAHRVAYAVEQRPDILLSLHVASHYSPLFYGPQTLYRADSPAGHELAAAVQNSLAAIWPGNCQRPPAASRQDILAAVPATVVTVEAGFLSNRTDRMLLGTSRFKRDIAKAINQGVIAFLSGSTASRPAEPATESVATVPDDSYGLYFTAADAVPGSLTRVPRPLPQTMEVMATDATTTPLPEDTAVLARSLLEELRIGPADDRTLCPVIPPAAQVDSVVIQEGTAVICFSPGLAQGWDSNLYNEETMVNAIVQTVRELPGIKRVQILLGGEAEVSLSGHLVLGKIYD